MNRELLRRLPKVDEILNDDSIQDIIGDMSREEAVDIIRAVLDGIRNKILSGQITDEALVEYGQVIAEVSERIIFSMQKSLRPVINASGVILHTNLGRALMSEKAQKAVMSVAGTYSTLEYDPVKGGRGLRHVHVESIIQKITGAEAAMVVNNNAAATMITMSAIGAGRDMIISRGELVEIGGSFRIPEIMEQSGSNLVEIGTTNKTKLSDYEKNISEETGAILKVHTSNYRIIGFTDDVPVEDLVDLGHRKNVPVIYDLGGGLMIDLEEEYGIAEPTVEYGLNSGADVVLFSGDKLLGGPQAGIIIGKKEYIDKMKAHPLARILRVDKVTLSALEATFNSYYNKEQAMKEIPVLNMITRDMDEMKVAAEKLASKINGLNLGFSAEVNTTKDMIGGGTSPGITLDGWAVEVTSSELTPEDIESGLRRGICPIVTRIHKGVVIIAIRTLISNDAERIVEKLELIAKNIR